MNLKSLSKGPEQANSVPYLLPVPQTTPFWLFQEWPTASLSIVSPPQFQPFSNPKGHQRPGHQRERDSGGWRQEQGCCGQSLRSCLTYLRGGAMHTCTLPEGPEKPPTSPPLEKQQANLLKHQGARQTRHSHPQSPPARVTITHTY